MLLTGQGGFLPELVKAVLERGLATALTAHLGYEVGDPAGRGSGNSATGSPLSAERSTVASSSFRRQRHPPTSAGLVSSGHIWHSWTSAESEGWAVANVTVLLPPGRPHSRLGTSPSSLMIRDLARTPAACARTGGGRCSSTGKASPAQVQPLALFAEDKGMSFLLSRERADAAGSSVRLRSCLDQPDRLLRARRSRLTATVEACAAEWASAATPSPPARG